MGIASRDRYQVTISRLHGRRQRCVISIMVIPGRYIIYSANLDTLYVLILRIGATFSITIQHYVANISFNYKSGVV